MALMILLLLGVFLLGLIAGVALAYFVGKWYATRMAKQMAEQMGFVPMDMDEIAKFLEVNR